MYNSFGIYKIVPIIFVVKKAGRDLYFYSSLFCVLGDNFLIKINTPKLGKYH